MIDQGHANEPTQELRKLNEIKCAINPLVKILNAIIPTLEERQPINKLTRVIFKEVRKNLGTHPKEFYQDGNFPQFLDAMEKAIIYITETDPHYRVWLGYFYLAIVDLVGYEYDRFNYRKYYEQHREALQGLSLKDPIAKPVLFLHFLGQHGFKLEKPQKDSYVR
jgi:hypothetical protein